jgi:hypothetical protein
MVPTIWAPSETYKPLYLFEKSLTRRVGSKYKTGDANNDNDQRGERENRIVSQRRCQPGNFMLAPACISIPKQPGNVHAGWNAILIPLPKMNTTMLLK